MASFISFINIPVFITALALGLFVYLGNNGDERKITVYPTPENIRLLMYKDHRNVFRVQADAGNLSKDPKEIKYR
jgi:hypothetical protein